MKTYKFDFLTRTGVLPWLLFALLFSSIFIPRLPLSAVTPFYRVDLRMEDLLLAVLVLALFPLAQAAFSSVEKAFLIFLIAAEVSMMNGLFFRTIDKPLLSLLYLVKWFEYFLVFVLTGRLAKDPKSVDFFIRAFFLLGVAAAAYGYWEYFFPAAKAVYPNYFRLFERPPFHGDANHMGGLLVLWLGFFTGIFLREPDRRRSFFWFAALLFVFFPLLWTYSRKSYFALAGAVILPFLFPGVRRRLLVLLSVLTLAGLLLPTRLSERLLDLGEAFTSTDPFHSSWAGNWVMWKQALWNFDKFFLFGSGLGSRHRLFYESQLILILAETGLAGLGAFVFLWVKMVRQAISRMKGEPGIALGWLLGFAGLLIHNFSCVSWTVSKIAIPFWFLSAAVFARLRLAGPPLHETPRA